MTTTVKCPTCKRPVEWSPESVYRPFCSDRCRLVDLGAWFSEKHRIADQAADEAEEPPPDSSAEP
ncbi:MAG: DNA gyrase inhibitor YacG [Pseudomonadota bacterium]|nr:DNA gyrase inhibitor YacG [Pseudomonadota bacterium]